MKKFYSILRLLGCLVLLIPSQAALSQTPCITPTGLANTNVSQTGAVLNITPATNTAVYNIRYQSANSTTWTTLNNVSMPYQLGNLSCGTAYYWQAQTVCANSGGTTAVSLWSAPFTFVTLACTPVCNPPTGLTATNISQTGAVLGLANSTAGTLYNIRYRSGTATTWTTLSNVSLPYQLGNLTCSTAYVWQAQTICPSTATTPAAVSNWSPESTFSTLTCATSCNPPLGIGATNISQTGAVLNITPATNTAVYNIRYQSANSTTWTTINNVSMPYQLGNLSCGTAYYWQAQTVCANSGGTTAVSVWSAPFTFVTLACTPICNAPTGLSATGISQTSASLYLTPTSTNTGNFNIRYRLSTAATWITVSNVTLPYTLANLICGNSYQWQAQAICPTTAGTPTALSNWSAAATFTTLTCTTTCNPPTGLTATNTSQTGAILGLANSTAGTLYNIRYRIGTATTWTTLSNVGLPYQLGNLTCSTAYVWQAQTICPSTATTPAAVSNWSTESTFSTLTCATSCNPPLGLGATNISQTGAVLNITPATNTAVYNIRYQSANSTTWTTINNVSMPYQLGNLSCGTAYYWQAQTVCANSGGTTAVSVWSAPFTFVTLACTPICNAPAGLSATGISQTSASLYLTPTSTNTGNFNIRYRLSTAATWITVSNVTLPYTLANLICGNSYQWQAQAICPTTAGTPTALSNWSAAATFTTLTCTTTCNPPTGLTATNTSQTVTVLGLANSTAGTLYNIRYRSGTATTWTTLSNVGLPYQLGNLTCSTAYVWQAQTICPSTATSAAAVSNWSTESNFSTSACVSSCMTPMGLLTTNITIGGATLSWTPVGGALGYVVRYRPANSITASFTTVTTTTNSLGLSGLLSSTTYLWQVQAICGSSATNTQSSSAFSPSLYFTTAAVVAFPNPVNRSANLSIWAEKTQIYSIRVRDTYGNTVRQSAYQLQEGVNTVEIFTESLAEGIYILTIESEGNQTMAKMIVKH